MAKKLITSILILCLILSGIGTNIAMAAGGDYHYAGKVGVANDSSWCSATAVSPNGDIYIRGYRETFDDIPYAMVKVDRNYNILEYTEHIDTSIDGSGGNSWMTQFDQEGNIYVISSREYSGYTVVAHLWKYNSDGAFVEELRSNTGQVAFTVEPDGSAFYISSTSSGGTSRYESGATAPTWTTASGASDNGDIAIYNGEIYVGYYSNNVRVLDATDGTLLRTLDLSPTTGNSAIASIAINPLNGNIVLTYNSSGNHLIYEFSPTGEILTIIPYLTAYGSPRYTQAWATNDGKYYITNKGACRILEYDSLTGEMEMLSMDNIDNRDFFRPYSVDIGPNDNVYIGENNRWGDKKKVGIFDSSGTKIDEVRLNMWNPSILPEDNWRINDYSGGMTVLPNGNICGAWIFESYPTYPRAIVCYGPDGGDPLFIATYNGWSQNLAYDGVRNQIVASGTFTDTDTGETGYLLRVNMDGTMEVDMISPSTGECVDHEISWVDNMTVRSDGSYYMLGGLNVYDCDVSDDEYEGYTVWRVNVDGTIEPLIKEDWDSWYETIDVDNNGNVFMGGGTPVNGVDCSVVKYIADSWQKKCVAEWGNWGDEPFVNYAAWYDGIAVTGNGETVYVAEYDLGIKKYQMEPMPIETSATVSHTLKLNVYDSTSLVTMIETCDSIRADQTKNNTYTKETYEELMKACNEAEQTLDCINEALQNNTDVSECGDPETKKEEVEDILKQLVPTNPRDPRLLPPNTDTNTWNLTLFGKTYAIPLLPFITLSIATIAGIVLTIFLIRRHIKKNGIRISRLSFRFPYLSSRAQPRDLFSQGTTTRIDSSTTLRSARNDRGDATAHRNDGERVKIANPWSKDSYKVIYQQNLVDKHKDDPLTEILDVSQIVKKYRIKYVLWHTVPVLAIVGAFVALVLTTAPTQAISDYADISLTTIGGATTTIINVDKASAGNTNSYGTSIQAINTDIHDGGLIDEEGGVYAKYDAPTELTANLTLTAEQSTPAPANNPLPNVTLTESTITNPNGPLIIPAEFDSTNIDGENTFAHTVTLTLSDIADIVGGSYTIELTYTLTAEEPAPEPVISYLKQVVENNDITTMQGLTGTQCAIAEWDDDNNGINDNNTVILTDERNDQDYMVRKMPDDNCWMITNLKISLADVADNPSLSNPGINTTTLATQTAPSTSGTSYTDPRYYDPPGSTNNITDETFYGYLYNWCAATGGTSTTCTASGTMPDDATTDICPANWRLPTGGLTGEFAWLNAKMNNLAAIAPSTTTGAGYTENWQFTGPFRGVFSGGWIGSFGYQGTLGSFWSSSRNSSSSGAFGLYFSSTSYVNPGYNVNRSNGYGVRCLLGTY